MPIAYDDRRPLIVRSGTQIAHFLVQAGDAKKTFKTMCPPPPSPPSGKWNHCFHLGNSIPDKQKLSPSFAALTGCNCRLKIGFVVIAILVKNLIPKPLKI